MRQVSDGINKADELIELAMSGNAPVYHSGNAAAAQQNSGKSGGGAASNLKADYKSYLSNERGKSPARDDADATAAMNKVTAMPY